MPFEIMAHRGNDTATIERLLAERPSSIEIDVGLLPDGDPVVAHDYDLGDTSGLTVPEALGLAGATPVVIEAKCAPPQTAGAAAFVAALTPVLRRVAVVSFNERFLVEVRRRFPSTPTTYLFEQELRHATVASTLGPRHDLVTAELVRAAHTLGLRVVPWTVNDPAAMSDLIALGVDGLVTDEPALARDVLANRLVLAA